MVNPVCLVGELDRLRERERERRDRERDRRPGERLRDRSRPESHSSRTFAVNLTLIL